LIDKKDLMTNILNKNDRNVNLRKFIESILPNISVNGIAIDINRCVVVDLITENLQPFPCFHTDIEWNIFNNSNGFQVWYLYENHDKIGNMFILETNKVKQSTFLRIYDDKRLDIISQCKNDIIEKYNNYNDINPQIKYLDMKSGECLIFGQNTYHTSDYRKSRFKRSINFRVILTDEDGGITINKNTDCFYNNVFNYKMNSKNIKIEGNKMYPKMFDLMELY
jgi:hypothetical protein